jgi:uncharacterized protein involved in exopolysaccharide biosynthesis
MEEFFVLSEPNWEVRMPEYEIEVTDYFKIIWKRKWLIFFGTLFVVGIAAIASFVLPKTYETVGYLRIGKIDGRFIESPVAVRAQITSAPYAEKYIQSKGLNLSKSDFRLIVDAGARIEIIRFTASGPSRETIEDFLRFVVDDTVSSHRETYMEVRELKDQREQELKSQMSYLEERITEMKRNLKNQESSGERRTAELLVLEGAIIGMETQLSQIKDSYTGLVLNSAAMESNETVLLTASAPASPARPNLRLNILVGSFLGLMIFIAIALFLEYYRREDQGKFEKVRS